MGKPAARTLSHLSADGQANMVDVSDKAATDRVALADGALRMARATLAILEKGQSKKGDVLGTARLAGIMAAKRTAELIPLCHPLPLTHVQLDFEVDRELPGVRALAS